MALVESLWNYCKSVSAKRLFVFLVLLGFGLRIGFAVARYRTALVRSSGQSFIELWDHDALDHVLISKALLDGKGYVVEEVALPPGKHVHYQAQEALHKAPLYEFFLVAAFAVSGFSFQVLLPAQALLGGLLAGFVGLIGLRIFRNRAVAWFAGIAAAAHPILVNSASQPYNENLFFCLYAAAILSFLVWVDRRQWTWALLSGVSSGLCILTRENGTVLLAAMGLVVLFFLSRSRQNWMGYGILVLAAIAVVSPWTIRNYVRFGVLVPVTSILGADFVEGNNACVGGESVFRPYWAEAPCPWVNEQLRAQPGSKMSGSRIPLAVRADHALRLVGMRFVRQHPFVYLKLAFRRFWTTLLPYDPRGKQTFHEKAILLGYWLLVFPAGILGMLLGLKRAHSGRWLVAILVLLNLASITAVLYWSDLRFRVGIDLLLGCFAGWVYAELGSHRGFSERSFQAVPGGRALGVRAPTSRAG